MARSRRTLLRGLGGVAGIGGIGALVYGATSAGDESSTPEALVAGSLLRLANRIPDATVEAHGSVAVQRLIHNGMRDPDAVALADPRLFEGISERATLFATNALVIAYAPGSEHATAIEEDWRTAIERDGIRLGRTDPTQDPLGYRTVMALRLAESASDVEPRRVLGNARIFRETDMLNLVEGGKVDAAFAYRNMAVQRDLPYVPLPDEIDFSSPDHADAYSRVSYDLGERTVQGAPIRYAATALTAAGREWIERLVTGEQLLENTGFVVPAGYPRRDVRLSFAT